MTDHFLNLRQSYLSNKFKLVNSDGSDLAADAKAGLVNYAVASLFQQVDDLINGNLIYSSVNTSAYTAMIEVLLGCNQGAKNYILPWDPPGKTQQRKQVWWQWAVLTVDSK